MSQLKELHLYLVVQPHCINRKKVRRWLGACAPKCQRVTLRNICPIPWQVKCTIKIAQISYKTGMFVYF